MNEGKIKFERGSYPQEYTVYTDCIDGVMRYVGRVEVHKDFGNRPARWAAYRGSKLIGKFDTRREAAQHLF